jgi:hypothetical protein
MKNSKPISGKVLVSTRVLTTLIPTLMASGMLITTTACDHDNKGSTSNQERSITRNQVIRFAQATVTTTDAAKEIPNGTISATSTQLSFSQKIGAMQDHSEIQGLGLTVSADQTAEDKRRQDVIINTLADILVGKKQSALNLVRAAAFISVKKESEGGAEAKTPTDTAKFVIIYMDRLDRELDGIEHATIEDLQIMIQQSPIRRLTANQEELSFRVVKMEQQLTTVENRVNALDAKVDSVITSLDTKIKEERDARVIEDQAIRAEIEAKAKEERTARILEDEAIRVEMEIEKKRVTAKLETVNNELARIEKEQKDKNLTQDQQLENQRLAFEKSRADMLSPYVKEAKARMEKLQKSAASDRARAESMRVRGGLAWSMAQAIKSAEADEAKALEIETNINNDYYLVNRLYKQRKLVEVVNDPNR